MSLMKIGILGLGLSGCLLGGCDGADEGVELGTYLLTPESRDFRVELYEDGTFWTFALEWDLTQTSSGVWSHEDGETVLRPENDEPAEDSDRDEPCPARCVGWSTSDGLTSVTVVRLEPSNDPEVIEARFYDRAEERNVIQVFTLADPDAPLPGI